MRIPLRLRRMSRQELHAAAADLGHLDVRIKALTAQRSQLKRKRRLAAQAKAELERRRKEDEAMNDQPSE